MNQNRDGQGRHRITADSINHWPNRKEAVPPAKTSECGYVDYPAKVEGIKQRLKSTKFSSAVVLEFPDPIGKDAFDLSPGLRDGPLRRPDRV